MELLEHKRCEKEEENEQLRRENATLKKRLRDIAKKKNLHCTTSIQLIGWEGLLDLVESDTDTEKFDLSPLYELVDALEGTYCAESIRFVEDDDEFYCVVQWKNARFFFDAVGGVNKGSFSEKDKKRLDNVSFKEVSNLVLHALDLK